MLEYLTEKTLLALLVSWAILFLSIFCFIYSPNADRYQRNFKGNEDKVVVITGCDSGFGYMTAIDLASQGFRVIATCLTDAGKIALNDIVDLAIICDVTKCDEISSVFESAKELIARNPSYRLWAVINNAGIAPAGLVDWSTMDSFRSVMEVNYFGLIAVSKAFLPLLKCSRNSRIINISSMAGISGSCGLSAYVASKHAVEGFAKCFRQELHNWNLFVCNVNPGFMNTPLISGSMAGAQRAFDSAPEEIRGQYPANIVSALNEMVPTLSENPRLVVDAIVDLVYARRPPLRTVVGVYAWMLYLGFETLPFWIQDRLHGFISKNSSPTPEALAKFQRI